MKFFISKFINKFQITGREGENYIMGQFQLMQQSSWFLDDVFMINIDVTTPFEVLNNFKFFYSTTSNENESDQIKMKIDNYQVCENIYTNKFTA